MEFNDNDWDEVYLKLRKSWRRWGMIARVLERTGAMVRAWGDIYKKVAQSVLHYKSMSWVVTGEMLKVVTALNHRAARQITGMTAKCGASREWEYPG